jgi:hypothetical protein
VPPRSDINTFQMAIMAQRRELPWLVLASYRAFE